MSEIQQEEFDQQQEEFDQLDYINLFLKRLGSAGYTEDELLQFREEIKVLAKKPDFPGIVFLPPAPIPVPSKKVRLLNIGESL